jgi:phage terminase Nu1 subunit (DNA packaging protein)
LIPATFTTDELAELVGCTEQRLGQLVADGTISRTGRNEYPRVAVSQYCAHLRKLAAGTAGAALTEDRSALVRERTAVIKLQRETLAGTLIPVSEIEPAMLQVFAVLRNRLLAIPSKVAARLGMAKTTTDRQTIVRQEIHAALTEFAAMGASIVPGPPANGAMANGEHPAAEPFDGGAVT